MPSVPSPPDAPPPRRRTRADDKSGWQARLQEPSYSWGTSGSPTLAYLEGRERVLGRRRDIDLTDTAEWLADELGPLAARAFARALVREMEVSI